MFKNFTRCIFTACLILLATTLAKANDSDQVNCGRPYKIVVLGSSTAYGTGATPADSSWVNKFTNYALRRNVNSVIYNFGIPGFTTYEALLPTGFTPPEGRPAGVDGFNITSALALQPDAIIINLPSNDALNNYPVKEQQTNYERAVLLANAANVPVWIATTQPRNNFTSAQTSNLTQMRDWIISRFGVKSVDFWTTIANADGTINNTYNYDGTHVNNAGHQIFYTRMKAEGILDSICLRNMNILIARAGADTSIILPGSGYSLNGSASSGPNPITDYLWTKIDGPAATSITNANSAITTLTNLAEGRYTFVLKVTDNTSAIATDTIKLIVGSRILFDFGPTETTGADANGNFWNNITTGLPGPQLDNAITTDNASTTIDFAVTNRIDGTFNVGGPGTNTGNAIGIVGDYPASATTDFAFAHPSATDGRWTFTGLEALKQYTFKFWGTRDAADDRIIQIKRADQTVWQEYNASNNDDYLNAASFTFAGKTSMAFDIRVKDGSAFGHISVVDITRTTALDLPNLPPVANAGTDVSVTVPANTAALDGTASTDDDGTIVSYQWTKLSGPAGSSITGSTNAAATATGLTEGIYTYELKVTDNNGAFSTDVVTVTVGLRVLFDFGATLTTGADAGGKYWNNVPATQTGVTLANAISTSNTATAIGFQVVNRIDGTFNVDGPGTNTGNTIGDVGDYPNSVTTDFSFAEPSATNGSWKFTGLDATKQYTFKFWGTRSVADDRFIQIKRNEDSNWQEYNATNNSDYNTAAVFTFTGKTEQSFDIKVKDGSAFGHISVVDINATVPPCVPVTPTVIVAPNATSVCNGTSVTFTATATNSGTAPVYQWTKNNTVIENATGSSYTTNALVANDAIRVVLTSNANCATTSTVTSVPVIVTIKQPTSSLSTVSACSSYLWNGVTYVNSGTYTKTGLTNAAGCDSAAVLALTIKLPTSSTTTASACNSYVFNGITYTASGTYVKTGLVNKAGCDSTATLVLTINKTPSVPTAITGPSNACPYVVSAAAPNGVAATYIINKVAGATSYNWTVPANVTITSHPGIAGTANDTIIVVKYAAAFSSGNISVTATSTCGTSSTRTLAIGKSLPAAPGTISGVTNACPNITTNTSATYKISKIADATDYDWTISGTGASITGHPAGEGINDTIVTVMFTSAFSSGTIAVKSVSNCGTNTTARTLAITKSAPTTPTITGNLSACGGGTYTYTASSTGATSYVWTLPSGCSVIGSATGASITVRYPSFFLLGIVSVRAVSACGTSATSSFIVLTCGLGFNLQLTYKGGDPAPTTVTQSIATTKAPSKNVETTDGKASINVFPNPTDGNFTIAVKGNAKGQPITIEIVNNYGQAIYKTTATDPATRLSIANRLANGIYFVRTNVNGQIITQKLIVSR